MAFEQAAKFVVEELVIRDNGAVTFPDNTVQTTAYVGDLTLAPKYGLASKMTSGTITIAEAETYQSTGLTATLDALNSGISLGTTDAFGLKNTSGVTRIFDVMGSIDMGVAGAGDKIIGIKLALNGVPIDGSECRAWSIGGKAGKLVTFYLVEMEPDDEVSLFVANISTNDNISFSRGRIVARTI